MTDEMQSIRDDIAYLRAMAQSGRDGTDTGAVVLMTAGGCYGVASAVQWAALSHFAGVGNEASLTAWFAAMVLFFAALFWTRRQAGAGSRSRASVLGWQATGSALFVLFCALGIATWRTGSPVLISFSPSIVTALYGAAWMVAALVTKRRWLWLMAYGSFAAALVSAWLVTETIQWLFYALYLFLLAFVPGLIFTWKGRAAPAAA